MKELLDQLSDLRRDMAALGDQAALGALSKASWLLSRGRQEAACYWLQHAITRLGRLS